MTDAVESNWRSCVPEERIECTEEGTTMFAAKTKMRMKRLLLQLLSLSMQLSPFEVLNRLEVEQASD